MALVPDRRCGECTVCCVLPAIDTAEFQKQAGVVCRNRVEGVGCAIHEALPTVCREFHCGWRQLPLLNDAWRPDRSGVLMLLGVDEVPAGLNPYQATKFVVVDPSTWVPNRALVGYVAALVEAGAATYLAAPGPPGRHALKSLVNARLGAVVASRDDPALARALSAMVGRLAKGPFDPVVLTHRPPEAPQAVDV